MVWQVCVSDQTLIAERDDFQADSLKNWLSSLFELRLGLSGCSEDFYVACGGHSVHTDSKLHHFDENAIFHVSFRMRGGKGGFGSLLRAIGSQIERTTNREACRDLTGRRLRDVHNERRLKEWLAKQRAKRNTRKLEVLKSKLERMRSQREGGANKHLLHDSAYIEQCNKILETIDDAMQDAVGSPTVDESELSPAHEKQAKSRVKRKRGVKRPTMASGNQTKRALIANEESWLIGSDGITLEHLEGDVDSHSRPTSLSGGSEDSESDSDWSTSTSASSQLSSSVVAQGTEPSTSTEGNPLPDLSSEPAENLSQKLEQQENQDSQLVLKVAGSATESSSSSNSLEPAQIQGKIDSSNSSEQAQLPVQTNDAEPVREPVNFAVIELDEVENEAQLAAFGEAHLKHELARRGLKCGGTLQERATRLLAVKGLRPDQIPQRLRARAVVTAAAGGSASQSQVTRN